MKTSRLACSSEITDATRNALRAAIMGLWTTSQIGVSWVARHEGNADYYQLDGLAPLAVATKGPILLLANSWPRSPGSMTDAQASTVRRLLIAFRMLCCLRELC